MWTPARYNLDSQRYNTLLKELQDFFGTLRGRGPELAEELQYDYLNDKPRHIFLQIPLYSTDQQIREKLIVAKRCGG